MDILPNWIFVTTGEKEELKKRFSEKRWPIYRHTIHRTKLSKGDRVIVYHGGYKSKKELIGSFTIETEPAQENLETFYLEFSDLKLWKQKVPVKKILSELSFVKRKDNWGIYFQGGVVLLPNKDLKTILSKVG